MENGRKRKIVVLDSTCFIQAWKLPEFRSELFTTGLVAGELRSAEASARFSSAGKVRIANPSGESIGRAKKVLGALGDRKLSEADISVLALAIELEAEVATDDYSLQNACRHVGIQFLPVSFKGIGEGNARKFPAKKGVGRDNNQ